MASKSQQCNLPLPSGAQCYPTSIISPIITAFSCHCLWNKIWLFYSTLSNPFHAMLNEAEISALTTQPQLLTPTALFPNANIQSITGGTFLVAHNLVHQDVSRLRELDWSLRGSELLKERIIPAAFYDSEQRSNCPRCHPKTRKAIRSTIMAWVKGRPENHLVLWLNAPMGAGKSAISNSIAECCHSLKLLAAGFFFSGTATLFKDTSRLVATLVWQLIHSIPEIREAVLISIGRDKTLLSRNPMAQMKALIIEPLNQVPKAVLEKRPRLIIIDGFDECPPCDHTVLQLISALIKQLTTPLYFLLASRRQPEICNAFDDFLLSRTYLLPLEDDDESAEDIRVFLESSFDQLRIRRPYIPTSWPSGVDIQTLVKKSSGQFIYPAIVVQYIQSTPREFDQRLQIVLRPGPHTEVTLSPFSTLDSLLIQILESIEESETEKVLEMLYALILMKENRLGFIEEFFGYRRGELLDVMGTLNPLVHIPESEDEEVKIHHGCLPDFLFDRSRSDRFFLDRNAACLKLARRCTEGDQLRMLRMASSDNHTSYAYLQLFVECIVIPRPSQDPNCEDLINFLHGFSIWDKPGNLSMLFNPLFSRPFFTLLTWLDAEKGSSDEFDRMRQEQLAKFDRFIHNIFSSIQPENFQFYIPTAISLYVAESPTNIFEVLLPWLSDKIHPGIPKFLSRQENFDAAFFAYLSARLLTNRRGQFQIKNSHYADFALFCAQLTSEEILRPSVVLGMDRDIYLSVTMHYLFKALPHSNESRELLDLLRQLEKPLIEFNILPDEDGLLPEQIRAVQSACREYSTRCAQDQAKFLRVLWRFLKNAIRKFRKTLRDMVLPT